LSALACPACGGELWEADATPDPHDADAMPAMFVERESDLWCYRVRRFRRLGFSREQRLRLADQGADWHEARDLIDRGCPADVAFDLLSS
jgi:hypothetical protein